MSTLKTAMAVILIVTEVPAAIFLVYQWFKDCRKAKERQEKK